MMEIFQEGPLKLKGCSTSKKTLVSKCNEIAINSTMLLHFAEIPQELDTFLSHIRSTSTCIFSLKLLSFLLRKHYKCVTNILSSLNNLEVFSLVVNCKNGENEVFLTKANQLFGLSLNANDWRCEDAEWYYDICISIDTLLLRNIATLTEFKFSVIVNENASLLSTLILPLTTDWTEFQRNLQFCISSTLQSFEIGWIYRLPLTPTLQEYKNFYMHELEFQRQQNTDGDASPPDATSFFNGISPLLTYKFEKLQELTVNLHCCSEVVMLFQSFAKHQTLKETLNFLKIIFAFRFPTVPGATSGTDSEDGDMLKEKLDLISRLNALYEKSLEQCNAVSLPYLSSLHLVRCSNLLPLFICPSVECLQLEDTPVYFEILHMFLNTCMQSLRILKIHSAILSAWHCLKQVDLRTEVPDAGAGVKHNASVLSELNNHLSHGSKLKQKWDGTKSIRKALAASLIFDFPNLVRYHGTIRLFAAVRNTWNFIHLAYINLTSSVVLGTGETKDFDNMKTVAPFFEFLSSDSCQVRQLVIDALPLCTTSLDQTFVVSSLYRLDIENKSNQFSSIALGLSKLVCPNLQWLCAHATLSIQAIFRLCSPLNTPPNGSNALNKFILPHNASSLKYLNAISLQLNVGCKLKANLLSQFFKAFTLLKSMELDKPLDIPKEDLETCLKEHCYKLRCSSNGSLADFSRQPGAPSMHFSSVPSWKTISSVEESNFQSCVLENPTRREYAYFHSETLCD